MESNYQKPVKSSYYRVNRSIVYAKNVLKDLKESISGVEKDFTTGSINRAILLLSIPMVLEMALESVFAVVDIYFVNKLGAGAVATVGITESILTLVYAIGIGLSMATTAMVARRIGEKNKEGAASAVFQSIILALLISLPITMVGFFFSKDLLALMGASHEIVEQYYFYPAIALTGNIVIMLLFVINAAFRSAGEAVISMKVLWLANIINIVLDPCLIFGIGIFPELGIKGAAIASLTGRGIAVLYQFYLLWKGTNKIVISRKHVRFDSKILAQLIRLSYGGIGQYLIATASWVVLMRIIAEFGSTAIAGYTIAIRIAVFTLLPTWGLSNATATLVGQNLGAKKPDRSEKSVWRTAWLNSAYLFAFAILFWTVPEFFINLFHAEGGVMHFGSSALKIISYGYIFYGMGMIFPQAFNGAGDTATPTWINLISYWIIQIPLAYVFAMELHLDALGVMWSIVIAETFMALCSLVIFTRGKWKLKVV